MQTNAEVCNLFIHVSATINTISQQIQSVVVMTAVEKTNHGYDRKAFVNGEHGLKREFIFFQLKQRASTEEFISTKVQEHKLSIIKSIQRDIPLKQL